MTRWTELGDVIKKTRSERKKDWLNALVVQIRRAADANICAVFESYRIKKIGRTIEVAPRGGVTTKAKKIDIPAIALIDLDAIDDAKLSFRVILAADEKRLEQYTVSVTGREKASGRSWYVRVDLDDEQKGEGPCSHAMLHGHVGVDPAEKDGQESRVPLPWLDPDEALVWIFATLKRRLVHRLEHHVDWQRLRDHVEPLSAAATYPSRPGPKSLSTTRVAPATLTRNDLARGGSKSSKGSKSSNGRGPRLNRCSWHASLFGEQHELSVGLPNGFWTKPLRGSRRADGGRRGVGDIALA
jgi:hypothetical protein